MDITVHLTNEQKEEACDYGITAGKPYTATQVRDAIVDCFAKVHKEVLLSQGVPEDQLKQAVMKMLTDMSQKLGDDIKRPTKKSLQKLVNALAKFSGSFRSNDIIAQRHKLFSIIIGHLKR